MSLVKQEENPSHKGNGILGARLQPQGMTWGSSKVCRDDVWLGGGGGGDPMCFLKKNGLDGQENGSICLLWILISEACTSPWGTGPW